NKMFFTVEQEFPLWGKLDLRRDQASADVARSRADTRVTEAELVEKVKVAFAQYYQSDQAIRTTEDLHRVVHDIARVARERYAQIAAAAAGKQLADKNWYPDVMLKAGAIDRTGNGPNGYLAEIGLRVPLQWGLHEAQQREAAAQVGAAQARRQAQELQIQG